MSIARPEAAATAADRPVLMPLEAYTHDISEIGMALVVPVNRIDDLYLGRAESQLPVTLELPTGLVHMQTTRARVEESSDESERGYLIGVRIAEMNVGERARYMEYLHTQSWLHTAL